MVVNNFGRPVPKSKFDKRVFDEKEVRAIVDKADLNGDGSLSMWELKKAFKEMGSSWPLLRAWRCMRNSDRNRDGKISSDEKKQLVSYIMNWYSSEQD